MWGYVPELDLGPALTDPAVRHSLHIPGHLAKLFICIDTCLDALARNVLLNRELRLNKAGSISLGLIARHMQAQQRVILKEPISNQERFRPLHTIIRHVQVAQCLILHECVGPLLSATQIKLYLFAWLFFLHYFAQGSV